MYEEELDKISGAALQKAEVLKNRPAAYMISSVLGGIFIGIGVMLTGTISGLLNGLPYVKLVNGFAFTVALSLIVMAGGELFTGNSLVMTMGVLKKKVGMGALWKVWFGCWIGNWIGSVLTALLFVGAGGAAGACGEVMAVTAVAKMSIPPLMLFLKALLCNLLVCLAVWCTFRCKSESGKLIMIFWCIFAFYICGFEHSVANMTYLTVGLLRPLGEAVSIGGYFYNILLVSAGNIAGGALFVALPFYLIGRKSR